MAVSENASSKHPDGAFAIGLLTAVPCRVIPLSAEHCWRGPVLCRVPEETVLVEDALLPSFLCVVDSSLLGRFRPSLAGLWRVTPP